MDIFVRVKNAKDKYIPTMKTKQKTNYETPQSRVFELRAEGVLCASGETEPFSNGNSYGGDSFFD